MNAPYFAVIILLSLACGVAHSKPNPPVRPIETTAPQYPDQAYAAGHQGKVLVKIRIRADGSVETAEVQESSKSQPLDDAALAAVKSWKFSPSTDADGNLVPADAVVPLDFAKDSTSSVLKKPCSDLNADVKFFRASYPEKPLSAMRIYKLTLGMLITSEANMEKKMMLVKTFSATFANAISKCESKPDDTYGSVLSASLKN